MHLIWLVAEGSCYKFTKLRSQTPPHNDLFSQSWNQSFEVKKEEIWLSPMTKAPTPTENSKKQGNNIKKRHKKIPITQRLRTALGRSVGVTAVTPLVWLNQFTSAQPSHSPQK